MAATAVSFNSCTRSKKSCSLIATTASLSAISAQVSASFALACSSLDFFFNVISRFRKCSIHDKVSKDEVRRALFDMHPSESSGFDSIIGITFAATVVVLGLIFTNGGKAFLDSVIFYLTYNLYGKVQLQPILTGGGGGRRALRGNILTNLGSSEGPGQAQDPSQAKGGHDGLAPKTRSCKISLCHKSPMHAATSPEQYRKRVGKLARGTPVLGWV
ncbi:hypothetical protein CCACVL1_23429 [Corchorus capsularis]|uniref:Uncharacterized protein n=1 Tax=Corchorus capsularis TaxID=210143 RepID=A0A1R3GU44_COCAP|nr:hypothetical protein CCACVL1_23429 [Corchorus capsularis]